MNVWRVSMFGFILVGQISSFIFCTLPPLQAQAGPEAHPAELRLALGRLDSTVASELKLAEEALAQLTKNPAGKQQAICGLALLHIKQNNSKAIKAFASKTNAFFPNPNADLKSQLLRIQLWNDLAADQPAEANEHFFQLVKCSLGDALSQKSQVANAAFLGNVIGWLEPDAADSPIKIDILRSAKIELMECKQAEIAHRFKTKYDDANRCSRGLAELMETNAKLSHAEFAKLAQQELTELESELVKQQGLIFKNVRELHNQEEQIRLSRVTRNETKSGIQAVMEQWRKNPQVHNPIPPDRSRISVATTEKVYDGTERVQKTREYTDENGKSKREKYYDYEKKYRTEKRSKSDIDRDIDAIYLPLLNQYQNWIAIRDSLIQNRQMLDAKLKANETEIETAETELKEFRGEAHNERDVLTQLQVKKRVFAFAIQLLQSGQTTRAFRPPYIEIFDYEAEKRVILQ